MASRDVTIETSGLQKFYGEVQALRGIDFTVNRGEIVGFLGPNGAGKSTTMKILTGFMSASSGTARVAGFDVQQDGLKVRQRVGYLPESVPLYESMLVFDYLMFMAEMRGVPASAREERVRRVIRDVGLGPVAGKAIEELSKGYRQRCGLAQALVHEPEVLILDEPTSGLDPNQIVEIREVIRDVGRSRTVLLSTHILQEIEALCDRIILIAGGRVVANGTIPELFAQYPQVRNLEELFRMLTGSWVPPRRDAAAEGAAPAAAGERSSESPRSDSATPGPDNESNEG